MVVKVAMPQQFKLKVVPSLKGLLFPNQKEVHYIGGSEVLPPPLETERETEDSDQNMIRKQKKC